MVRSSKGSLSCEGAHYFSRMKNNKNNNSNKTHHATLAARLFSTSPTLPSFFSFLATPPKNPSIRSPFFLLYNHTADTMHGTDFLFSPISLPHFLFTADNNTPSLPAQVLPTEVNVAPSQPLRLRRKVLQLKEEVAQGI